MKEKYILNVKINDEVMPTIQKITQNLTEITKLLNENINLIMQLLQKSFETTTKGTSK